MSTLEQTIYADPSIGLTVTAWAHGQDPRLWVVRFRRRIGKRVLLDQTCSWSPLGFAADRDRWLWCPVGSHLIPSPALAAVEEWLAGQAPALGVKL
jgi:hypothetical protein